MCADRNTYFLLCRTPRGAVDDRDARSTNHVLCVGPMTRIHSCGVSRDANQQRGSWHPCDPECVFCEYLSVSSRSIAAMHRRDAPRSIAELKCLKTLHKNQRFGYLFVIVRTTLRWKDRGIHSKLVYYVGLWDKNFHPRTHHQRRLEVFSSRPLSRAYI